MSLQIINKPAVVNFTPRDYQKQALHELHTVGKNRAVWVWHRRAGKDKTALCGQLIPSMLQRSGCYYHWFPTAALGRKVIWDGVDKDGFKVLDHFPKELIAKQNDQEMKITYKNGSIYQVVGTDKNDTVGPNPVGNIFSEYALQHSRAWEYTRPILAENGGWAIFAYTPRGNNHGKELFDMSVNNKDWDSRLLTVDDTHAITQAAIQAERDAGMPEDMIQQEFYCSFTLGVEGAYYAKLIVAAYNEGRVGFFPAENNVKVYTFWDLGIDDDTAIWFVQFIGSEIRVIDYYYNRNEGLNHYAKVIQDKPYVYGGHYFPPDVRQRMQGAAIQSRYDILCDMYSERLVNVIESHRVADGITSVKGILSKCRFNEATTKSGIKSLENYRQKYDEQIRKYSDQPLHDWSSHAADAFRYLAVAYRYSSFEGKRMGETMQEIPIGNNFQAAYRKNILTRSLGRRAG